MSAIDDMHTLTIRLRELSRNQSKLDTTSVGQLKQCCRSLLNVLETLSRIHASHPATVNSARWNALSAVEAAKRVIWLLGRPLTAR